jgi:hypothetical protein
MACWELRKRALEFAWELVARFATHIQGAFSLKTSAIGA